MDKLIQIIDFEGKKIDEEFRLASTQGAGTSQEIADFRENSVQIFIKRFYPQSFVVTKGKITSIDGEQSNSIDCLVLNPVRPNLLDSSNKFRLIIADACDHAIKVKPNLACTDELIRALDQCRSVKAIKRSNSAVLLPKLNQDHLLQHSLYINFAIFSISAFELSKLYEIISDYYKTKVVDLELQIDAIFILGKGLLKNIKHKERNFYGAAPPIGKTAGWYFEKWDHASLVGLLFQMEYAFPSYASVQEGVLSRLLKRHLKFSMTYLGPVITPT
jgi:hypothetical protein